MVDSCSAMPPLMFLWGFGFMCFLTIITPSTRTRFFSAMTRRTRPCLPLSLPAMTATLSLRLILILVAAITLSYPRQSVVPRSRTPVSGLRHAWCAAGKLDDLGCERDDFEELLLAELAGYRTENAGADRLVGVVDDHSGVLIETNVGAVPAAIFLPCPDDNGLYNFTFFDGTIGRGFLDRGSNDIAEACLFAETATEGQDHLQLACAGVVGHIKHCSHLY